jgi:hypothetical protein
VTYFALVNKSGKSTLISTPAAPVFRNALRELCSVLWVILFSPVLMLQAFRKKDLFKSSLGSRTNKFVTQSKGSHYKKITTTFPFCLSRNYMFVAIFTGFVTVASR